MKTKTYSLLLTRAMVVAGEVVRAGNKVELDEAAAKDFLRRGKAEFAGTFEAPEEEIEDAVDLSRMNKAQLVEVAQQKGIENADDLTKAKLIEAIEAAE